MNIKSNIRKLVLTNRQLLSEELVEHRSKLLSRKLSKLLAEMSWVKNIHTFLPIKRNGEVDTWQSIELLKSNGYRVMISKTDFETESMDHFLLNDETVFQLDKLNIPTPINGESVDIRNADVVLVPLLAADRKGGRIGYGKGYYDRLVGEMRSDTLKIGLNLAPVFDDFTFLEPHDEQMDYCITPFEIIDCRYARNS